MREIDVRALFHGVNARRARVSVVSPSSAAPDPVIVIFSSAAEAGISAFQDDAFQDDAFQ